MILNNLNETNKRYGIIYTDPPWQQSRGGKKSVRPNSSGIELPYHTMSMDNIVDFHEKVFDELTEEKHNVFMWTIDKYLPQTEQFMSQLGYKLHARIIWDKVNGIPSAFTVRYAHEYLLWFYKPNNILMPCKEARGKYTDVMREMVTKHSKKPLCAYEMLDDMFPDANKLELFARSEREGWDCYGDEV